MDAGAWSIKVSTVLPQRIATAAAALKDKLYGAEYEPIVYLGSQIANGSNHAVLATQTVLSGRDTKNIVILIFNEKPNEMVATLISVERLLEEGLPLGGVTIEPTLEIPQGVKKIWDEAFSGFVGSRMRPFAYLGSKVTEGPNYIFASVAETVSDEADDELILVAINPMKGRVSFTSLLTDRTESILKYAFTW